MTCGKKDYERSLVLSEENIPYGNFYDALQTDASKRSYTYGLRNFMNYLAKNKHISKNEDFTKLVKFDAGKSTDLVKAYIKNMKKRNLKPLSVNAYLAPVFLFFDMNRVGVFKKEINKVRDKNDVEQAGHTPVTDQEIQNMVAVSNHPKDIALILFLSSTGMRPGGLNDPPLCMKHLEYMADPVNPTNTQYCYAVKIYDGSRQHYWGFLTPEATKALEKYFVWRKTIKHEEFTKNSAVFANVSKKSEINNMSGHSLYRILLKIYDKSGLVRIKEGYRYDKAISYMYRIRFNTILKLNNNLNSNIAEKLMAHKKGLDGTYLQPTREECFTEFVKAIPQLTVSPIERQQLEIQKKNEEITELQEKQKEIDDKEETIADMQKSIKAFDLYMQREKSSK